MNRKPSPFGRYRGRVESGDVAEYSLCEPCLKTTADFFVNVRRTGADSHCDRCGKFEALDKARGER